MNLGLHQKDWLAAGEYTIADMICYPWAAGYKLRKIDLDEFPNVKRWMERMEARPAVKKAMEATLPPEAIEDPAKISDEEKARRAKLLVNQRATKIPAAWG
jgi:GSH-dependent disulfide-bond oxidoreductase